MMVLILVIILLLLITLITLAICNPYLPKWACTKFGWHLPPLDQEDFDGCSASGICPRCGKKVLLDSQGNWF